MVSRVLGFARDMLIANVIGAGLIADAFFVAFKFPNFFRRLFAEGAFNAAFVPLFAGRLTTDGKEAAVKFAGEVASVLGTVLLVFTLAAMLTMPWLMLNIMLPATTATKAGILNAVTTSSTTPRQSWRGSPWGCSRLGIWACVPPAANQIPSTITGARGH